VECRGIEPNFQILDDIVNHCCYAWNTLIERPTLPKIEVARVKPVESTAPNLRLSDHRIDLMSGFSLSSNQAIGGAWGIPVRPPTPFDERYGQW